MAQGLLSQLPECFSTRFEKKPVFPQLISLMCWLEIIWHGCVSLFQASPGTDLTDALSQEASILTQMRHSTLFALKKKQNNFWGAIQCPEHFRVKPRIYVNFHRNACRDFDECV